MQKKVNHGDHKSSDPNRTIAEPKDLRSFTADENGAQRVAFTKTWVATRAWLKKKLEELPVEIHTDAAGNLWTTLRGESERAMLIGGHTDSVPNGGWLVPFLNLLAAVEIPLPLPPPTTTHP